MDWEFKEIVEAHQLTKAGFEKEVLDGAKPVTLRGFASKWPLIKSQQTSPEALIGYLDTFYSQKPVVTWLAPREEQGRFFYNKDLSGFNFSRKQSHLTECLKAVMSVDKGNVNFPDVYIGASALSEFLPGLKEQNPNPLVPENCDANLWVSTRSLVAPHIDMSDNIAVVVSGRRRFTLFPPEQVVNLYLGPLDFTPAGQPLSLVDIRNPDLERFPRFAEAQKHSQSVVLEPGDAIYIPSTWWHGVEALDDINLLINYWWNSARQAASPYQTLIHALVSIAQLPAAQRKNWQELFNALVFQLERPAMEHLPEEKRGPHRQLSPEMAQRIKAYLKKSLI